MDKKPLFLIIFFSLLLEGCIGMAVSGAQAVYNRNYLQNSFNDHYLDMQINQAIFWPTKAYQSSHIAINTFNSDVLLTGQVPTYDLKAQLTQITKKIVGVAEVYNFTQVSPPISPLLHASDAWISSKIEAKLILNNDINPDKIKVVTENGVVYLMGMVFNEQAEIAIELARRTIGVRRVISLFAKINITKTRVL